jgi:toluene monooxygenase electron transfer component
MGARETSTLFVTLKTAKDEHVGVFECASDERLLYAGLRAGLPLPHECATGTCGSCKAKLTEGEVTAAWAAAPGLKFLKPGGTEVLLCQSYARSDCSFTIRPGPKLDVDAPNAPSYFSGTVSRSGMLTHDVLVVEVKLDRPMHFMAGQFALVEAEGVEGFRAYSMVNAPGARDILKLIVKRKPDGALSNFLMGRDIGGLPLKILGPLGRATFDASAPCGDLVCAAGGTGIAGLMSVLAEASASGHLDRHRACVFFGVRTGSDLFFLDRFAALKRRHPDSVCVVIATSEEAAPASIQAAYPSLRFEQGLVHERVAARDLSEWVDPAAYLAGPVPAVEALTTVMLTHHRLPPGRIRFDRFG